MTTAVPGELDDTGVVEFADDARVVELLGDFEPGPLAMMMLTSLDVSGLDETARVDVAAAWERQQAWVAAQAQAALAAVMADVPELAPSQQVSAQEWRTELVAASLRWSPRAAGTKLALAERLVREMPATYGLLNAGVISFRHAAVLAEAVEGLLPDEVAAVEARVLEKAAEQTVAQFTRTARRAALAIAPELAAVRHDEAVRARGVRRIAGVDGMAELVATLPACDAETVYLALDAVARKAAAATDEPLPIDAYRADALVAWANDALADPTLPRRQGRRVEVQVVIDLPTLLGMADNPAQLVGYGPVPAQVGRMLAAEGAWRRLVVDPVRGQLLDYGKHVYRPPQALIDYVITRDRRCRFPGCRTRADSCDIDHVQPAGTPGGITAAANCTALCRRHHRMKTHGGWRLAMHSDSSLTWTAPNGREFRSDATGQFESW